MLKKLVELKERFESEHGIIAYSVEFIASVGITFGSSFVAAKMTRRAIDKIAGGRELGKIPSFVLSVLVGFIPAFIGSFVSTVTMPSERVLKVGIINRERDRRDRELSHELLTDVMNEERDLEGEEA